MKEGYKKVSNGQIMCNIYCEDISDYKREIILSRFPNFSNRDSLVDSPKTFNCFFEQALIHVINNKYNDV